MIQRELEVERTRSNRKQEAGQRSSPDAECFAFQLDLLKRELDIIQSGVRQMDQSTQALKNWSVLVWSGSVSLFLNLDKLRGYIAITALPPLAFWFVDAWTRRKQRMFIFRQTIIARFLNSPDLLQAFKSHTLYGKLQLLDPTAVQQKGTKDFGDFTGVRRTFWFKTVAVFYLTFIVTSIILGLIQLMNL
jgi:hypothetical protein